MACISQCPSYEELHAWYADDRVIQSTAGWLLTAGQQGMHQGLINRDLMLILNYNVATDVSACLRNCLIFRFRTKHT
jgi:hypothetical protein